jgi:hypothetical protein
MKKLIRQLTYMKKYHLLLICRVLDLKYIYIRYNKKDKSMYKH